MNKESGSKNDNMERLREKRKQGEIKAREAISLFPPSDICEMEHYNDRKRRRKTND